MTLEAVPAADLEDVFVSYIQTQPLEKGQFNVFVSPPAPPRVHGAKFDL